MSFFARDMTVGALIQKLQEDFGIRVKESDKVLADAAGNMYRPRSLIRLVPPAGRIVVPLRLPDDDVLTPSMIVFLCRRLRVPPSHFGIFVH